MIDTSTPLAERMRPKSLDEFIGQQHLISEQGAIQQFIQKEYLPSMIFWGPPGVGKTTLASLLCHTLDRPFQKLSAINSGVKDIREAIQRTKESNLFSTEARPVLFIDEIHRFSKSQQDSLLEAVERGTVTLIGATTENPSFEINGALLSRCQVYVLNPLSDQELESILTRAIREDELLRTMNINVKETSMLFRLSGGDGRKILNALEVLVGLAGEGPLTIDDKTVEKVIKEKLLMYDRAGDRHYDIASALIKSIRGSDPQAAVYWIARMLDGGEDPGFIARRLTISAAEDIGLADPNALLLADACHRSVERIGMPEARIILSQCAIYLANAEKSNSAYKAIDSALAYVKETGDLPVPLHLRNAPTQLMKEMKHGLGYLYPHDYPGHYVEQAYLPESGENQRFYLPGANRREKQVEERLKNRKERK